MSELEALLFTQRMLVLVVAAGLTVLLAGAILRILYGEPALSSQARVWAAAGLVLIMALPVPLMLLLRPGESATITLGRVLYQQNCQQCHGPLGNRMPGVYLGSRGYLQQQGDATLAQVIREGKGVMPAWGRTREGPLSDEQVDMVLRYLQSAARPGPTVTPSPTPSATPASAPAGSAPEQAGSPPAATPTAEQSGTPAKPAPAQAEGDPATGQKLYEVSCNACHPGGGKGVGPALSGKDFLAKFGQDAALTKVVRAGTDKGMPGFAADRLTDRQLTDIIAYIRSLTR